MPYCTNCGTQIAQEMSYCPKCGRRLTIPSGSVKGQEASKQDYTARSEIRKGKLFNEWVKYAGLSVAEEPPQKEARSAKSKSLLFYILIVLGIAACIGLIVLLVKIW